MRVLLDTDVVLDVILAREPFAKDAAELLDLSERGIFEPYVSAITPLNIFYIARKAKAVRDLRQAIQALLQKVGVCTVDKSILTSALAVRFVDYEDAVQQCSATAAGLDAIVTRNVHDYKYSTLPVFSPDDFLQHLKSQQQQQQEQT
jgi:predicted nucleic acid-binding protein